MAGSILPVFAATTFITGTTVSPAADGIDIVVELACNAEYISHTPTRGGDRLRIQLDVTTVCRGISPTIIKSRGLHRPVNADIAKLLELGDIVGASGGLARTRTGEITIWVESITMLSTALLQPPEKVIP